MADSITIPVQVNVQVNQQQLNNVSNQITKSVNKVKGFKTKDFFAPITNSAKTLTKSLKGIQGGVTSLSNSFSGLKRVAIGALSLTALVKVGKEMVKLSSDLIEVQNVVDTVFGDMSNSINDFSKSALKSFGLTELQAKNFSSTIGAIVKASGVGKEATLEMSEGITKLTGDVASFYNLDHNTAFEKLRSGITGETEPLKSLGVVMTVDNLEAYRLAQGITTSYQAMSQAEKTALRYNFILDTLSDTQGDFSKTQGSWSNQVRIMIGQIQQLGAILGGFLQKILYPILTVINQILSLAISGATALAKMFGFDMESIQVSQGAGAGAEAGIDVGDTGAGAMEDLANSTDDATKAQKKLNKEQNKSLANIHELNVLSSNKSSDSSSDSSGVGAGGVGGAGIGDIGFDLSKYKDISEKDNPINNLFKNIENAVKNNDWRGVGSLLADELNELMSKIDLAQYIPAVEKGAFALAEILNGFVQNVHFDEIGRIIGEGANLIMAAVNKFYDQFDFISLGQQIARGFNSLLDTVDFEALGKFLVNEFNAIFQTLAGFVTTFDWSNLGIKLAEGINSIFDNFDFESLSIAIYAGINGVFNTIGTTILKLKWNNIGSKFAKSFSNIFSNIDYGMILVTIIRGIEGILLAISTFFAEIDYASITEQLKTGLNQAIYALGDVDWTKIISNLSTGITNLASSLSDLIKGIDWIQLGANLYDGIKSIIMNIDWVGMIGSIGGLISNAVGALCTVLLTMIVGFISDMVGVLWGIAGYISDMLKATIGLIMEFVGNIIGWVLIKIVELSTKIVSWFTTLITNIGTWLGNIWTSISTWFTNLITNIVTWFSNIWTSISNWFTKLVTNISTWLGNVWTSISTWFTNLLTNVGTWLGNILTSLTSWFTSLPSKINGLLSSVGSTISGWFSSVWTNFTSFLGNIISYITGTFKTAWSGAWNGITNVFSGLFNTIGGIFKGVINTVVDAINTVINAINKISWDVPDWVPGIGGSTFGFSIPTVPKLAKGAVIPPNQEFLAILGDQKRGVNIETPLDTMLQAFRGALAEFTDYNGGDIIIPIYINNELSSEEIIRRHDIARYRSNGK